MSNLTIRPATAADADALVAIACREWAAIYDGFCDQLGEEIFSVFYPGPSRL